MQKYWKWMLMFIACFLCFSETTVWAAGLSITYNGKTYQYEGKQLKVQCSGKNVNISKTSGILEDGYALLPYGVFSQSSLGVKTTYSASKKTITFQYDKEKVVVTLNSKTMLVNGKKQTLPVTPKSVHYNAANVTKILVPSRSIAEALGLDYAYNSKTATVSIKQKEGKNIQVEEKPKVYKTLSLTYGGKTYSYTGKQLSVECGKKKVDLSKTPGFLEDGYAMLPYKAVFGNQALGVKTSYNATKKAITFQKGTQKLVLTINSKNATLNGKKITLPTAPKSVRYNQYKVTTTVVPSRIVADSLGLEYVYTSSQSKIQINSKNTGDVQEPSDNHTQEPKGRMIQYNGKKVTITKKDVNVKSEGKTIKTPVDGVILNNIAMVPAYYLYNKNIDLGTTYKYNSSKKQATLTGNGNKLVLTMGKKTALLNGKSIALEEPAWLIKEIATSKTYCMVPAKSTAEALGFRYAWDNKSVTALVSLPEEVDDGKDNPDDTFEDTTEEPTQDPDTTEKTTEATTTTEQVTTEEPISTGTTEEPSNTTETSIGVSGTGKVTIPRPDQIKWAACTIEDDYHNRQLHITLPDDYEAFYLKNPIMYDKTLVTEVNLSYSNGKTKISIRTPKIRAYTCKEQEENWELGIKAPKEIYNKIIVIDAGHGGEDPGSMSSQYGVIEKNTTLNIAQKSKKYFSMDPSIKVYYTRLTDSQQGITYGNGVTSTTISVKNRAEFANEVEADLFISVHCNSVDYESAKGSEVLYSSKNTSVTSSGLNSKKFADLAFPFLLEAIGSEKRSVKDSPNLIVCKNTKMPAILLETAFLSNQDDATLLKDDGILEQIAKALYDIAVETWKQYPTGR